MKNFLITALIAGLWAGTASALTLPETRLQTSSASHAVDLSDSLAIVGRQGRADLFDLATGTALRTFTPHDPPAVNYYGTAVGVSGNRAIIGSKYDSENGRESGAAYLYDTSTGNLVSKLLADDGAPFDAFGHSVAISGNTVLVGSFLDDDTRFNSGSVYVFDAASGAQLRKLKASVSRSAAQFGYSVDISGDTAVIGARQDGSGGAAYLFDVSTGTQIAKLTASDPGSGDFFGHSVAISGNVAIVGAYRNNAPKSNTGAAYLFDATTGAQLAKLTVPDADKNDYLGYSVAISGNVAAVSGHADDDQGTDSGATYLFDVSTGTQLAKLTASDAAAGDQFGYATDMFGDRLLVGTDASSIAYLYDLPSASGNTAAAVPLPAGIWMLSAALGLLGVRRAIRGA